MSSFTELMEQANQLIEKAKEARKLELADVIAGMKETIAKYELTAEDLGFAPLKHTRVKKAKEAAGAPAGADAGAAGAAGVAKTEGDAQAGEAGQPD